MKSLLIVLLFIITGCTAIRLTQPAEKDLEVMQQKVPSITYQEVVAGYNIYRTKCNGCHGLYKPAKYTPQQWERLLPEMMTRAKIYDESQKKLLMNFLFANSR